MPRNSLVLIHGYSDKGESFAKWEEKLGSAGFDGDIHSCSYRSLTNEVTIKDIAEGFDRALRIQTGLKDEEPFDAIVHSTGMLVLRCWLTSYRSRVSRLKRLIGLAPATAGSPLAHKGRSWLGSLFKGNKQLGPDFMEAGDLILDGLELGSRFTWDLAHKDFFGSETYYGPDDKTPYVFVFCGTKGYGGLRSFANEPGTDGTVRLAGTPMNCRKIVLDLTRGDGEETGRVTWIDPPNIDAPLYPITKLNHGTIMGDPSDELVDLVSRALKVESKRDFEAWSRAAREATQKGFEDVDEWQQFVVRAMDERGDPITDYFLELTYEKRTGLFRGIRDFDMDVHPYAADKSLRCFHVNLSKLKKLDLQTLHMRVVASSGSDLVTYCGVGGVEADETAVNEGGKWDASLDLSKWLNKPEKKFFYPFTTTYVELKLNREPAPPDLAQRNKVLSFLR